MTVKGLALLHGAANICNILPEQIHSEVMDIKSYAISFDLVGIRGFSINAGMDTMVLCKEMNKDWCGRLCLECGNNQGILAGNVFCTYVLQGT